MPGALYQGPSSGDLMEAQRVFPGEFGFGEVLWGPVRVINGEMVSRTPTRQLFQRGTENSRRDLDCPWEFHSIWIGVNDVV